MALILKFPSDMDEEFNVPEAWQHQLTFNEAAAAKFTEFERDIMRLQRKTEYLEDQLKIWQRYCQELNEIITAPKPQRKSWWMKFTRR